MLMAILAISIAVFIISRCVFIMEPRLERVTIVTLMLLYVFLRFPLGNRKWTDPPGWLFAFDLLLFLTTLDTGIYTWWGAMESTTTLMIGTLRLDYVVGIIVIGLSLKALRRSFGLLMVGIILFFFIYTGFADIFPGTLQGAKATFPYLMEVLYVEEEGIYGIGTNILLNLVFPFLMFGSLLISSRLGAFFTSLAMALVGRYSAGPAKVAVIGSGFLGSISGSSIANVATTGAVTIPLMKSIGFTPRFAAAVEATASSGGYMLPPVMGVAAFVIAGLTGIPYIKIAMHAAIPALLYYLGVFVQVHFRGKKDGLAGLPPNKLPSTKKVMAQGWHMLIPFIVLVTGLVMGYSVTRVAIWAILCIILLSFIKQETRLSARQMLSSIGRVTDRSIGVSIVIVCAGYIFGLMMVSGLGMRLSLIVQSLAGDNLILALLLAAAIALILGMAGSPMLVYVICYVFVIPALIAIGVDLIAASMFVLFIGVAAGITPPVCIAAYTAAHMANAPPMRTGFTACKLGFAAYLVSFMMIYHPGILLLDTTPLNAIFDVISAAAGIVCIAAAIEGWFISKATIPQRLLLLAAGGCLFSPSFIAGGSGMALMILLVLWQKKFFLGARSVA